MALGTVTLKRRGVAGDLRWATADVVLDSSYPTGGTSVTATTLGFPGGVVEILQADGTSGLVHRYDYTNKKLMSFYPTGGATSPAAIADPVAVAPTATLANAVIPAGGTTVTSTAAQPALTITQPTISAPALTAGRAKEVANATDLSSLTVRVFAWISGV